MSIQNGILDGSDSCYSPSIDVKGLCYAFQDGSMGLQDINLSLPPGSRTLLIGGTSNSPLDL